MIVPVRGTTNVNGGGGRENDPPVLILTSLASGPKHGYALLLDIEGFAGVRLGPGTLYGAISRLEERGLIEPVAAEGRARPYRLTAEGAAALESTLAELRSIVEEGTARLRGVSTFGVIERLEGCVRILRAYPPAWRARYGEELAALIEALDGGSRMSIRDRLDIVRSGVAERLHTFGLSGVPPRERAREGSLLVLYGWVLFVIGGFGVAKASEHWQAVTPAGRQGLPSGAFAVLFDSAGVGSALVLIGVAVALPSLWASIRSGGWARLRWPIVRAGLVSLLWVVSTFGLARWAHSLTPGERNGGDAFYSGVFLVWVLLFATCLFVWAAAAAATARQLLFRAGRCGSRFGSAASVTVAMAVMTAATIVWWGALASAAPWFFAGRSVGSGGSGLVLNMVVPAAMMLCATALGLIGAKRGIQGLATLPGG